MVMKRSLIVASAALAVTVPSLLLGITYVEQVLLLALLIGFCAVLWNGIRTAIRERRARRHLADDGTMSRTHGRTS